MKQQYMVFRDGVLVTVQLAGTAIRACGFAARKLGCDERKLTACPTVSPEAVREAARRASVARTSEL